MLIRFVGYAFVCTPTGRVLQIIPPQDNPTSKFF